MKKALLITYLFLLGLILTSCHKDNPSAILSSENNLTDFSVTGQKYNAVISAALGTVTVTIPSTLSKTGLTTNFSVSTGAIVTINGAPVKSGAAIDFSKVAALTVTAPSGAVRNFTVTVQTDLEAYGFSGALTAQKSLNKTYSWYYDQGNSGTYSAVNCGPASVTMAIKWADSTFTQSVVDARNTYRSTGGWWYTDDIANYLNKYGINFIYTSLPDNYQTIKNYLDKNDLVILCLDNYYLTYNSNSDQHVDKFYKIGAAGSGHFIVVKGYKIFGTKVYFEAYDPFSNNMTYSADGALKGLDRYYTSDDLEQATTIWWDYAIVIAPKGKRVNDTGLQIQTLNSSQVPVKGGAGGYSLAKFY